MASEYYKQKFKDVQPDEKREYTKKEKAANWWYYHKWHVVMGLLVFVFIADIGRSMLGIGKTKYDYQIAFVSDTTMSENAQAAVEEVFASFGEDLNNDGKITVCINQYPVYLTDDKEYSEDVQAAQVSMIGDIDEGSSYLFILDDPEVFQDVYGILAYTDGTLPETTDDEQSAISYACSECSALMEAAQEAGVAKVFEGRYIAQRGYWTDVPDDYDGYIAFWNRIITE